MQKKPVIIFMMMVFVFIGSQIAIAGMGDAHKAHMMGGGMMDESGDKGPDMMMHKMNKPMMYPWDYMKDRLNLTEEQADKFGKLYSEYRKEVLRKRVDIEIAMMELTDLIKNRSSSEKAIEDGLKKLELLRSGLHSYRIKTLLKTKEFLSDDQYGDLVNFISGWTGHHRRGMPWGYDNEWDDDM